MQEIFLLCCILVQYIVYSIKNIDSVNNSANIDLKLSLFQINIHKN